MPSRQGGKDLVHKSYSRHLDGGEEAPQRLAGFRRVENTCVRDSESVLINPLYSTGEPSLSRQGHHPSGPRRLDEALHPSGSYRFRVTKFERLNAFFSVA